MPGKSSKKLVNEATTDDLNPPAGYVLQQLATKTVGSVEECQVIEDFVLKKLEKNKPYVKHKALRIIKYICDNGHPSWRIAWQRHSDKIRACAHFRGPPDPIHGDAPYERVRAAAKVAMDAVFSTTTRDRSAIGSRIKGMSGDTPAAPTSKPPSASFKSGSKGVYSSPSGVSGGSKMTGYGNTDYIPKARPDKFKAHKDMGTYNNNVLGASRHSTKAIDNRHNRAGKRTKGQVGGVWGKDRDQEDDNDEADYDEDFQDEPEYPARSGFGVTPSRPRVGGRVNTHVKSDGTFEQNWVDGVASGGGVGGRISDSDLKKFVQQFENLSKSHALEALEDKLTDGTWQQQTKSLTLITALLKGASADTVEDYFADNPDCIESLMEENRSAVRKKATSIAKIIGLLDDEPVQRQPPPRQAAPAQTRPPPQTAVAPTIAAAPEEPEDLLGFDTPAAAVAPTIIHQEPQVSAAPTSLFQNLSINQSNGTTAPTQPIHHPVVPQQAAPVQRQPASNGPAAVNDLDWMSSLAQSSPSKPAQVTPSSFDPMSGASITQQAVQPVMRTQPVAASSGSAFSFVQQPQQQPQPQAASFAFMANQSAPMGQPPMNMGMGMAQPRPQPQMQGYGAPMGGGYQMGMSGGMGNMGMGMGGMGMGMNQPTAFSGMGQPMGQPMRMGMGMPVQHATYTSPAAAPRYPNGGDPFSTLLDPSSKAPPPKQTQNELFSEFSLK